MRSFPRQFVWALCALAAAPAAAQDVMPAIRGDRWFDAATAAAQLPDPVAGKLVTFYHLLAPGGAPAAAIAAFMADNPDWPQQAALAHRRDEALAAEPDDALAAAECDRPPPPAVTATAALLRCADADARLGRGADAAAAARRAWVTGLADPASETRFLQRWAAAPGRDDQRARFDRLVATDPAAAQRQLARLDAADRPLAAARLALRRDDPAAAALVAALPAAARQDPALVLAQAGWLRRTGREDEAVAFWAATGGEAERRAAPERLAAFWEERNLLARRRLRAGDDAGAYALAAGHALTGGEALLDAEFLAGFVALRRLNAPEAAAPHFRALAAHGRSAITQARANFWLARTAEAAGDAPAAKAAYAQAAAWPTAFYGQLAALALGEDPAVRIRASRDPVAGPERAGDLAGRELARAAIWLVGWGEPRRAPPFLLRLDDQTQDAVDRASLARLATALGLPDVAVALARRAGRDGGMLLEAGWPEPVAIPDGSGVEPALALAVIRQESSFDPSVVSPAGARGLMQLLPATASQVAGRLGAAASLQVPVPVPALTGDPALNVRLGTAYLRRLLDRFGGAVPLAIAAYNAGPARVQEWLAAFGDPRAGPVGMLDWLELIPIGETRNYVQRVMENAVIYRAHGASGETAGSSAGPGAAKDWGVDALWPSHDSAPGQSHDSAPGQSHTSAPRQPHDTAPRPSGNGTPGPSGDTASRQPGEGAAQHAARSPDP